MKATAAALATGAVVLALIGAPVAHTDPSNATDVFLARVHAGGFSGGDKGDQDLIDAGNKVCTKLIQSNSAVSAADYFQRNLPDDATEKQADYFVRAAVHAFCSWKANELDAPVTGLRY